MFWKVFLVKAERRKESAASVKPGCPRMRILGRQYDVEKKIEKKSPSETQLKIEGDKRWGGPDS